MIINQRERCRRFHFGQSLLVFYAHGFMDMEKSHNHSIFCKCNRLASRAPQKSESTATQKLTILARSQWTVVERSTGPSVTQIPLIEEELHHDEQKMRCKLSDRP